MNRLRGPTRSLLSSLDTPGGHILVLLILVLIGSVLAFLKINWADRIALGAFSVLLFLLGGGVTMAARRREEE